jgi:hypothetical protein
VPANYLYNVALIAVTFVGFSTVFVTFREALGGRMSKYDIVLIRNILYFGVITISGCLLPTLLWLLGLSTEPAVRLSSGITAVPLLIFIALYPKVRRKATGKPMPKRVYIDLALVYATVTLLVMNSVGAPFGSRLAVHALSVTIMLIATFVAFLFGLDLLPTEPAKPVEGMTERPKRSPRRHGVAGAETARTGD